MDLRNKISRSDTLFGTARADTVTPTIKTERLPFTVRRVKTEEDLRRAVQVRHQAYARHVPEFARHLELPEADDYAADGIVLIAESKLDRSVLGSTRIRTNLMRPLDMEESMVLPPWLQGQRLVEATRLGVDEGRIGRVVKMALIKACFMYCRQNNIDWSVANARPGVDRQYEQLLFVEVFPGQPAVPLKHAGNLPHRALAFELETFEERYTAAKHPLLNFFFYTFHPDIDIGAPSDQIPTPSGTAQRPVEVPSEPAPAFASA